MSTLAEALAAFQGEDGLTFAKTKEAKVKDRGGQLLYIYKYADLGDILPVVRPLLAKHGLSWSSKPGANEAGDLVLTFRLLHASGEVDVGEMPLGVDKGCKPQELGSAITYARRYALTAQLNLATDEDDDGKAAQDTGRAHATSNGNGNGNGSQPVAAAPKPSERAASAKQRSMIEARARAAALPAGELGNVILAAAGDEQREWTSDEHAEQTLGRLLDRLPARLVNPVLEGIGARS